MAFGIKHAVYRLAVGSWKLYGLRLNPRGAAPRYVIEIAKRSCIGNEQGTTR